MPEFHEPSDEHGVKSVLVPWAREGSGFSLLMEAMLLTMPNRCPSAGYKQVGEHNVFEVVESVCRRSAEPDFSDVDIGVDEYSHKGTRRYRLPCPPSEGWFQGKVLFTVEGKGKQTVSTFWTSSAARKQRVVM